VRCFDVSPLPPQFPRAEVDVYRVVTEKDATFARVDFEGEAHYFTLDTDGIHLHSQFLGGLLMGEESQCTPNSVVEDLIYQLLYKLGIRRTTLYEEVEVIFDKITEGEVRGTREIREIRNSILSLYLDSSTLYFVTRKLSKVLSREVEEDALFAYERAEMLANRTSDLYNIYLTEVQNDLNIIIKKLTSISFIFLPITAVASIYAVSFSSLPGNFDTINFVYFSIPLILLGVTLTIYLRKIGWL